MTVNYNDQVTEITDEEAWPVMSGKCRCGAVWCIPNGMCGEVVANRVRGNGWTHFRVGGEVGFPVPGFEVQYGDDAGSAPWVEGEVRTGVIEARSRASRRVAGQLARYLDPSLLSMPEYRAQIHMWHGRLWSELEGQE